jgi:hypothetical protein
MRKGERLKVTGEDVSFKYSFLNEDLEGDL